MNAFLDRSEESITKKLETGDITAEEAIVARNRLDLRYRKPFNRLLKEVVTIKKKRKDASELEKQENQEYEENLEKQEKRDASLAKLIEITKNDKRKLESSNEEESTSEPEVKKPKISEEISNKLPKDGLSPMDWVVQEQQCEKPEDRDISDTFNEDN